MNEILRERNAEEFHEGGLNKIPETSGVYLFKNGKGEIIYIGKAVNLKNRVRSYFQKKLLILKTKELVKNTASFEIIKTESEFEALLLEAKLINKFRPKYNSLSKDDKHPLYIEISREKFPKIRTVRKIEKKSLFFGPFPDSRAVNDSLKFLRRLFPYCTEKRIGKKACFYSHLGLCDPCPNLISQKKGQLYKKMSKLYQNNVSKIKKILQGRHREVLRTLGREMNEYAKKRQFEKAAERKEIIEKLTYLMTKRRSVSSYIENPNLYQDLRMTEAKKLGELLHIRAPKRIEGYDISNLGGVLAAGSLVVFVNGEPDKSLYRRFKIKTKNTADDFAMLKEVLKRRLRKKEWNYPDLILVDGGEGQLSSVQAALNELKAVIPIVGLAKKFEEIVVLDAKNPNAPFFYRLKVAKSNPALSLLQRVRDEAHRFARKYHLFLREKNMLY